MFHYTLMLAKFAKMYRKYARNYFNKDLAIANRSRVSFNRLQSVVNAAARSIAGLRRSARITDTLASFHLLRASERIQFKLAVIVYRALHGTAPQYLSDLLRRVADIPSRRRLRSSLIVSTFVRLASSLSATAHFYRAMRCISAVFAVMQCPSVRQVRELRQNE